MALSWDSVRPSSLCVILMVPDVRVERERLTPPPRSLARRGAVEFSRSLIVPRACFDPLRGRLVERVV